MRKPRENFRRSSDFRELPKACCSPDFSAGGSRGNYKGISRKLVAVSTFSGVGIPGGSQLRARRTGRSHWRTSGGFTDFRELPRTYCLLAFGAGRIREDYKESSEIRHASTNFKEKSLGLPAKSPGEFFAW